VSAKFTIEIVDNTPDPPKGAPAADAPFAPVPPGSSPARRTGPISDDPPEPRTPAGTPKPPAAPASVPREETPEERDARLDAEIDAAFDDPLKSRAPAGTPKAPSAPVASPAPAPVPAPVPAGTPKPPAPLAGGAPSSFPVPLPVRVVGPLPLPVAGGGPGAPGGGAGGGGAGGGGGPRAPKPSIIPGISDRDAARAVASGRKHRAARAKKAAREDARGARNRAQDAKNRAARRQRFVAGAGRGGAAAARGAGTFATGVAQGDPVRAVQGVVGGVTSVLSKIGPVGIVAAAGLGAVAGAAFAVKRTFDALASRGKELQNYSGAIAGAAAQQDVTRILTDIREAQRMGDRYAELIQKQTEVEETLRAGLIPIKERLIDILIPLMDQMLSGLISGLEIVDKIYQEVVGERSMLGEVATEMREMREAVAGDGALGGAELIKKWTHPVDPGRFGPADPGLPVAPGGP
jgi:hypothetical protein